ncbi:MAG: polysaccharide biosynthesis/export family protein [Phycisphaerae bacterium]|nr:polysaccharide biosynthesis/export family protein [Phycisphaerae bacterium]
MKKKINLALSLLLACGCILANGCGDKFFDPTQIGRFRPKPAVNVILPTLGVAEETPSQWEGSEDPRPTDIMIYETDYVFGYGDIIRVDIFELFEEGIRFVNDYTVTETGKISIPQVGIVQASGLTESQFEEEIKEILSPNILRDPSVSVALMQSQQRKFSILGNGVPIPGRYDIPRYDFRLTDALAMAQVATQFNISYIYVTRHVTGNELEIGNEDFDEVSPSEPLEVPEGEMLELIAPSAHSGFLANEYIMTASDMVDESELEAAATPDGLNPIAEDISELLDIAEELDSELPEELEVKLPEVEEDGGRIEWEFKDGKWIPVQIGEPARVAEPEMSTEREVAAEKKEIEDVSWPEIGTGGVETRVIEIPTDKLSGGDPRYNIVIRPGDSVHVPVDVIGEYFIYGNTNNQGAVTLTGRPLTLKMAIAAAGGLGPLAWPKKCEVTRRIAKDREVTVMVDLEKIANGEQPDFFIKPLDLINVGTHPTSRWRAVVRNAFRATYGFGFIYDRNFADRDFGTSRPIPNWF